MAPESVVEAAGTHTLAGCIVAAGIERWKLVEVQVEELVVEWVEVLVDKQEQAEYTSDVRVIVVLHMKNWGESEAGVGEVLQVRAVAPDNCSLIEVEDEVGIEVEVVEYTVVVEQAADKFDSLAAYSDIQS